MDRKLIRILQQKQLSHPQLWDDVDLEVVMELGERYLESVHATPERTILMAVLLRMRQFDAERKKS